VVGAKGEDIDVDRSSGDFVSDFLSSLSGNGQSLQSLGLSSGGTIQ